VNILESARIALHGLRANRLRSILTTLGVIIGVAAVILLTSLGNGVQSFVGDALGSFTTQITVTPNPGGAGGGRQPRDLTDADAEALRDRADAPDIASVIPVVTGSAVLQLAGGGQIRASVVGSTGSYLQVTDRDLLVGRTFDESRGERNAKVVVLGPNPVTELFGGDAAAAVGQQVRIGRTLFRVIGVVAGNGQQDDVAIMPLGAARNYLLGGGDELSTIVVRAVSTDSVSAALEQVNTILSDRHRIDDPAERDFSAQAVQDQLEQFNLVTTILTLFISSVAGISLLVGGIGIANIMLVTVTERTREIGIRKAIGAKRRAILQQFLLEAMMLAGLGGLAGILVGIGTSTAVGVVLPQFVTDFPPPVVSAGAVAVSFSISVLIGLVAGGYPAWRAARLRPIEALRYQ
jgi:putative ABC transport system permease protein